LHSLIFDSSPGKRRGQNNTVLQKPGGRAALGESEVPGLDEKITDMLAMLELSEYRWAQPVALILLNTAGGLYISKTVRLRRALLYYGKRLTS
jgi:hypothetical protein